MHLISQLVIAGLDDFFINFIANVLEQSAVGSEDFYGTLLVIGVLVFIEGDAAGCLGAVHHGGYIIHNTTLVALVNNRRHEVAIHGGGLNEVATTGPTPTPAHPKVASPSRHNTGVAVREHKIPEILCQCWKRGLQSRPWGLPRRRQVSGQRG